MQIVGGVIGFVLAYFIIGYFMGDRPDAGAYLDAVDRSVSFSVKDDPTNKRIVMEMGDEVCNTIKNPNGDIVRLVEQYASYSDITPEDGGKIMGYASKYLCPGAAEARYNKG